jgi:hypothetical protein
MLYVAVWHTLYTDHSLHRSSRRTNNHHPLFFLIDVKITGIAILIFQILPKAQFHPTTNKNGCFSPQILYGLNFNLRPSVLVLKLLILGSSRPLSYMAAMLSCLRIL